MNVSLVIPTHDRPAQLERLVRRILDQTLLPGQVVIVSDAADPLDDGLTEPLRRAGIACEVLHRSPPSSAASRNAGLDRATGQVVLCLDDDMLPEETFLEDLVDLYRRDVSGQVDAIGVPYRHERDDWRWAVWEAFSALVGRLRWSPRRVASRYVTLPAPLRSELESAGMLPGGSLSLRRPVARVERFDERLVGYAFAEDREFSFRVGQRWAMFRARRLRIQHAPPETARGDWRDRGRTYVVNLLHVARHATEGGPGTWMLVGWDFAGTLLQYLLWGLILRKPEHLRFLAGMLSAIRTAFAGSAGRAMCER
jgi:glycosyltransferase involved in cell wall biosynthesis